MVMVATDSIRSTTPVSPGDQDFVWAYNDIPKAAVVTVAFDTSDATAVDHSTWCRGFTDGSRSYCLATRSQHGVNPTNVDGNGRNNRLVWLMSSTANTSIVEATFVQWLEAPGGIRLNFGTVSASAFKITVDLFGGDALSARVGTASTLASIGGSTIISPGFGPVYMEVMSRFAAFNGTVAGDPVISYGCADTSNQYSFTWGDKDAVTPSQAYAYRDNTRAVRKITTAATGVSVELTNWGSSSVTAVTRDVAESVTFAYLALGITSGSSRIKVWEFSTPIVAASSTDNGPGWKPQIVRYVMNQMTAAATLATTGPAGAVGWASYGATNNGVHALAWQDNVAASNTQSLTNTGTDFAFHAGTQSHLATFTSFASTGITQNWTVVDAAAKLWIGMAVEQSVIGAALAIVDAPSTLSNDGKEVKPATLGAASSASTISISGKEVKPAVLAMTASAAVLSMAAIAGANLAVIAFVAVAAALAFSAKRVIPCVLSSASQAASLALSGNSGVKTCTFAFTAGAARLGFSSSTNRTVSVAGNRISSYGPSSTVQLSGPSVRHLVRGPSAEVQL